jgi:aspartyl-tRNA synthetase
VPGKFYALPQSPQMYKQLLMVAGLDRYFQIARCMRDEDLRADRQPEFTQLDVEMSFAVQDDVFHFMEGAVKAMFKAGIGVDIPIPFPRLSHKECMDKFGSDKPDLRFSLELIDITDIAKTCGFGVFANAVKDGKIVKGVKAEKWGAEKSNQYLNKGAFDEIKQYGAKGLAWLKVPTEKDENPDKRPLVSSIAKFFSNEDLEKIKTRFQVTPGDAILLVADKKSVVNSSLSYFRNKIGEEKGWKDKKKLSFLWVTNFPLFAWDEEEKRWVSEHHPFTSPMDFDLDKIETDPEKVTSSSYDCVLNGFEIASGSIRIHDPELQKRIFRFLRLTEEDIQRKFGFFADALGYGTPPHAGIAFGIDRIIALMLKKDNIREVIAFPKTNKGTDLMSGAPSEVDQKQLDELHIKLDLEEKPN